MGVVELLLRIQAPRDFSSMWWRQTGALLPPSCAVLWDFVPAVLLHRTLEGHRIWQEKLVSFGIQQRINGFGLVLPINIIVNQISLEERSGISPAAGTKHLTASLHTYQQMWGESAAQATSAFPSSVILPFIRWFSPIQLDFFRQLGNNLTSAA